MPHVPLRERIFDAACFFIGRMGKSAGFRMERPLFIIGTGRCGSNLLVDILNSHPGISGFPGEANELWHPALEPFESASIDIPPIEIDPKRYTEISVAHWPLNHEQRLRDTFTGFQMVSGTSKIFFTKSAMISFMIPQILDIFPDAKFIHLYRFGPSVVESYFKKNFGKYSRYIYPARDYRLYCAKYWNDCILEIEEKKRILSLGQKGQFLEISYEDLCRMPGNVLVAVAEFLGVKPNDFRFNISEISSQNYKVADYAANPETTELLAVMYPGMKLKCYI